MISLLIGLLIVALLVAGIYGLILLDEKYPKLKTVLVLSLLACSVAYFIGLMAWGIGEAVLHPELVQEFLREF